MLSHATAASGSDLADLWIAKVVSIIFFRAPSHAAAAARLSPFRPVLFSSIVSPPSRPYVASPIPALPLASSTLAAPTSASSTFPQNFTFLISCVCRSGLHDDAVKLFEKMARNGHTVDDSFVVFLANSCFEAGKSDLATGFVAAISKNGCRFQSHTFSKLLTSLVRRDRVGVAVLFLIQHLGSQFLAIDTCSFNIIIKGLCRIGDLDTAFEFFNQMQSFCCVPYIVTYDILIDGLCEADQVIDGHNILHKIQLDSACVPNMVTYTSIFSGHCKIDKMEEAYELFDDMIGAGVKPSRVTFNVLINGYGKMGSMPLAISLYERMLIYSCRPEVVTFTSLIDGYCRSGQLDDAMKIWDVIM